jgi:hypothetical protein
VPAAIPHGVKAWRLAELTKLAKFFANRRLKTWNPQLMVLEARRLLKYVAHQAWPVTKMKQEGRNL